MSRVVLTALLIVSLLGWAAAARAQAVDPRSLVLAERDLPPGFVRDAAASSDTAVRAVSTFRGPGPDGPLLVRSTVTLAGSAEIARALYAELPAILVGQGFAPVQAPPLGDESAGYRSPDTLDGRAVVYWTVAARLDRAVTMTTVVEAPGSGGIDDAAALASTTLGRGAAALGVTPSNSASAGSAAPVAPAPVAPSPAPTVTPAVAAATALPAAPTVVTDALLASPPSVGGGLGLGGLSGLAALDTGGRRFVAVTDRGPNRDITVHGDKATAFLVPTYAPSIVKLSLDGDRLSVDERIPLRLAKGRDPITGGPEVSGLPNGDRDEPGYDEGGKRTVGTDPNGVDTEGIAVDPRDGSYWLCEEYGPSILHVATDGTILTRLVPSGLSLKRVGYEVKAVLPGDLLERKENRGFEGIAMSPDGGTLFAIMQSPLSIPNKDAGEASRNVRIVAVDVSDEPRTTGVYLYRSEPYNDVGAREQDDVKVGDLAAITATRLLVTERDSGNSAAHRKVYEIRLDGATDLDGRAFGRRPLEQMEDGDLTRAKIAPVEKRLVVDLVGMGFGHEFVEGLAIVDEATIAVVNDNNFVSSEPSELMLVRLPAPLR